MANMAKVNLRIEKKTYEKLVEYISKLQLEKKRRITVDEALQKCIDMGISRIS